MGFGINAATMAGVNQGMNDIEDRDYLRGQRERAGRVSDLNESVLRGQVDDVNRARGDETAMRGAAMGAYQRDQTTTAAGGVPGGRMESLKAMRDAAAARGDYKRVTEFDAAQKGLEDEGVVALTKAGLMGKTGVDLGNVFNAYGIHKVDPATVKVDTNGNISGNKADGTPFQGFNLGKMAVLTGLVKPDEYEYKDGFANNKRRPESVFTGGVLKESEQVVGADGKPIAKNEKVFSPKDYVAKTAESETLTRLGPRGVSLGPIDTNTGADKLTKRDQSWLGDIEGHAMKINGVSQMSGLDPANQAKVNGQIGFAQQIYVGNKNSDAAKNLTPALAFDIGSALQSGQVKPQVFTMKDGSRTNGVVFNGVPYFLPTGTPAPSAVAPQPVAAAPRSSATASPKVGGVVPMPVPTATGTVDAPVYEDIPPPPSGGKAAAFNAWFAKYGAQHEINQKILAQQAAEEGAARDAQLRNSSLSGRMRSRQGAGVVAQPTGFADGGLVKSGFGVSRHH